MKPPRFDYASPASLEEALDLLAGAGDEAKALAGGQSLVPLLAFRFASPSLIVDLNRIEGMAYVRSDDDDVLRVGALTRHRALERDGAVGRRAGLISEAVPLIGHLAIRNRGTVGGSIAHADPAAEWPAVALALDAEVDATSHEGGRTLPVDELLEAQFTTSLASHELLTEIRFRLPPPGAGSAFLELSRRHGDFAIAGAAIVLGLADGLVSHARIALLGVAATAVRAREAEGVLTGAEPTDDRLEEAAATIDPVLNPVSDVHGSADFRRHVARVLTRRGLVTARERARRATA